SSEIKDVYPSTIEPVQIDLRYSYMDSLIGKSIERTLVKDILTSLNIQTVNENEEGLTAIVPTNKVDVTRPCDLVEEILRIYGYNNVEISDSVQSCLNQTHKPNPDKVQNLVSDYLAANGFNEVMNNSLTKLSYYENNADFPAEVSVPVLNALSKDLGQMRQTLLYGLLECAEYNINRKFSDLNLFEFGNCYKKKTETFEDENITKRYDQTKHLAILTCGKTKESWQAKQQDTDFYYLKNIIANIFAQLRIDTSRFNVEQISNGYYQYALSFVARESKKVVATIGTLKPQVCKRFGIKQQVYYADLNWDLMLRMLPSKNVKYSEISKYPEVRRDLALIVADEITFAQIESVAYQTEKKLLKSVSLFDVYRGDKLPEGTKQYAVSFVLQDKEKTLTDKQIEAIMQKLIKTFEQKLNSQLR
ncbi:MAG: phenylalanine--tRNA ligase subunit beta, partial [Bacteroidales bacterium]|nr:phenylalanine--tRNA ligase subunit beta [Bacteroidales bacterium]